MEQITVWYISDNEKNKALIESIRGLGLTLNAVAGFDLANVNIVETDINFFIIDMIKTKAEKIINIISEQERLRGLCKFMICTKREIHHISKLSFNILHLEFISKPVNRREFLLLLEKTVIVERYRAAMKFISKEAEARIETYEGLMDINRKHVFESEKEKHVFEKILNFEKNVLKEQSLLNRAISKFTRLRQFEMFDMKKGTKADEMLSDLRKREKMDSNNPSDSEARPESPSEPEIIEVDTLNSIRDEVNGTGGKSAVHLIDELMQARQMNRELSDEVEKLLEENRYLKNQHKHPG